MSAPGLRTASAPPREEPPRPRASEFRADRTNRRQRRAELVLTIVAVAAIATGAVWLVFGPPVLPGSSAPGGSPNAPPIHVNFGAPVASSVPCGGGGNVTVERIPWINTTEPITTGEAELRLMEIYDGDYLSDPGAAPNVNASSVCTGAVPNPSARWYAVLQGSNGTNVLSYTVPGGWATVSGGDWNLPIPDGDSLVVVENPSLVASGFAISVVGFANGSPITGSVVL
ncbi:MAG TPA: hypothetical protein VMG99_03040 [Thermoplasmata archaeon]|nr:hypothetical protein [Thermoplasmata archaeon]